jgi:hypothetical protein
MADKHERAQSDEVERAAQGGDEVRDPLLLATRLFLTILLGY